MIRPSSNRSVRFLAPLALVAAACSRQAAGPRFATARDLPELPRRPDGVVVDPSPELPEATEEGDSAGALVALKPPLPEKVARSVVAAYFRAIVGEDLETLAELTTPDANAPNKNRGNAATIVDSWRGRMRHFRYRSLANEVLYQDADLEFYRYDDLETVTIGRPQRPPEMARSDLLLRVPMLVVRAGSDRAFGDEVLFLLRRDKDRFRIRQILEDFQLP